jgi:hypothetical protein
MDERGEAGGTHMEDGEFKWQNVKLRYSLIGRIGLFNDAVSMEAI